MTVNSVASMSSIVEIEIADEITEQDRKELILSFISAILMLIPGGGTTIDTGIFLGLRRILLPIGDIRNVALTYTTLFRTPMAPRLPSSASCWEDPPQVWALAKWQRNVVG